MNVYNNYKRFVVNQLGFLSNLILVIFPPIKSLKILCPFFKINFIYTLIIKKLSFPFNDLTHTCRHTIDQRVDQFLWYSGPRCINSILQIFHICEGASAKVNIFHHPTPEIFYGVEVWTLAGHGTVLIFCFARKSLVLCEV
jgi:hypothetical protein